MELALLRHQLAGVQQALADAEHVSRHTTSVVMISWV